MTRTEFAAELERLRRTEGPPSDNPASYRTEGCERCISCTFCQSCTDCYRCTHCVGCSSTTGSKHCVRCTRCHDCSHCEDSEDCTGSNYLVECLSCTDCTYCLGCVGLTKKEFHILNVPYPRSEYFKRLKALRGGHK
jgi:hypothetical protein